MALELGGGISVSVELVDDELELLLELPLPLLLFELPPVEPTPDELPRCYFANYLHYQYRFLRHSWIDSRLQIHH